MAGKDTMPAVARPDARFTYDDFLLFPDDGLRHEIIDGEHYVTPSPLTRHQRLVLRLAFALEGHLRQHPGQGEMFVAPFDVVYSYYDIVEPDLLLVAADQAAIVTERHVAGSPALVVEVLSRNTRHRDEGIKLHLFEQSGTREYWVVDPERELIKVWRRAADGSFPLVAELRADSQETLETPILPGFSTPLADIFASHI